MKKAGEYYDRIVEWYYTTGIKTTLKSQRELVDAKWEKFHDAKTSEERKKAIADVFLESSYLHFLVLNAGQEFHTGYVDCMNIIDRLDCWGCVGKAVESNYAKFMRPSSFFGVKEASKVASATAKKYAGRYTEVVPRLSEGYWVIIGKENGNEKVLKPVGYLGGASNCKCAPNETTGLTTFAGIKRCNICGSRVNED